jgi:hypothetical protein
MAGLGHDGAFGDAGGGGGEASSQRVPRKIPLDSLPCRQPLDHERYGFGRELFVEDPPMAVDRTEHWAVVRLRNREPVCRAVVKARTTVADYNRLSGLKVQCVRTLSPDCCS